MKMHENRNNNMEPFYDGQYVPTTAQSRSVTNNLKRPISLDLDLATSNKQTGKKQRNQSVIPQAILGSPELNMLKWGTPDLEKFIMSSDPLQTPTPSLVFAANQIKVKAISTTAYLSLLYKNKTIWVFLLSISCVKFLWARGTARCGAHLIEIIF